MFSANDQDNVFSFPERHQQEAEAPKDGTSIAYLAARRDSELEMERREALDVGDRAAIAMLGDGLGGDPAPRLSIRETTYVGGGLETIRSEAMDLASVVEGKQPVELHKRLKALVAEAESLSVKLAEWSSGDAA